MMCVGSSDWPPIIGDYLTRKDIRWFWTTKCQTAFQRLKELLTTAPVLPYPRTGEDYVLETDASLHGLGAVLSQRQEEDQKLHPVAYASRALSQTERNYGVTELETLAVVWAVSHFHHLLYGSTVTILHQCWRIRGLVKTMCWRRTSPYTDSEPCLARGKKKTRSYIQ